MQKPGTVAISAIAGMGGVGKTELATQYAHQHQAHYSGGVCWLNAKESNLAAEIVQLAQFYMNREVPQQLTLPKQVEWCWQNWQPAEGLVLVVLDDITDLKDWKNSQQLLPIDNRFRVLITTRLRNLDADIQELPLDVLLPDKALQLLTDLVGERRVYRNVETQNFASLLCEWLGYLPLGLQLVGQYLREDPDLSLAEMLQRLQAQQLEDEAINPTTRGVKAAFELSWRELDLMTQRVAELLSLFAQDVIPWKLVESAGKLLNWAKADVNEAKKQLYKRHLIQRVEEKEGCYKIHPLIRQFLQAKQETSQQPDELKQAFTSTLVAIAQEIPDSPTREFIESVQDAIPHLTEVAQNLIDTVRNEDIISVFGGLGRFYQGQGLYALAEPWREQCLKVVQARLGEEHPHVATSLNNQAELYRYQGRYNEAEPLFLQALALYKRLQKEEHLLVAESLNNLAIVYSSQGRYSEAEPLHLQALALRKRLLGDEHLLVAESLNNLALLYSSQGRYSEAETLLMQALALRKSLLGDKHPAVALSLNNLALLYYYQGRYTEAEPLSLEAIEIDKQFLGEENPDFATDLHNLALIYRAQERYNEAETVFLQALKLKQRLFPKDHPLLADTIYALGKLYTQQGRCSEAEPFCVKALELDKSLLGENHPNVAESLNNLAELYHSQGRYAEAEPLYQEALEILQQVFEVNHPKTVTVRKNLENLRTQMSASHENLTNLQGEKSASNSWFGTLLGFWR
ncbi:tetratricopeptide repeat protein [Scytonema sp. HK-05]|nr:tetratricopeptide repeat protein [Scytonema sp. HK-05]